MPLPSGVDTATAEQVRDTCLCLHAQRTARALARRFDRALRPAGLTNAQFSLLMALNRPAPASVRELAALLGADRTTLTAAFKPLIRQGLALMAVDGTDARARRITLTAQGQARLATALPLWRAAHAALEGEIEASVLARLAQDLKALEQAAGRSSRRG
jgi:DNA-binding MarR family transcriptional regulator